MSTHTFLEFRMMDIREIYKSSHQFDDLSRLFEDYKLTEINFLELSTGRDHKYIHNSTFNCNYFLQNFKERIFKKRFNHSINVFETI